MKKLSATFMVCCAGVAGAQDVPLEAFGTVRSIPEIVAKIESGHRWAKVLCERSYISPTAYASAPSGFADECIPKAEEAMKRALKSKKIGPRNCSEAGIAKGHTDNQSDVMRVSLAPPQHAGLFFGKITDIEGKTVAIYNEQLRLNAIVNVDASTVIFDGGKVAVGYYVSGYGIQTGTQKVQLVSGATSTIPVIRAMCL